MASFSQAVTQAPTIFSAPTFRGFSRPVTSGPALRSAVPQPSAKERWRSSSSTLTSQYAKSQAAHARAIRARGRPIIVDRNLYRELAQEAVKRTVENLRACAAEVAEQKKRSQERAKSLLRTQVGRPSVSEDERLGELVDRRMA